MSEYFTLSIAVLLPVIAAALIYLVDKAGFFLKYNYLQKQMIIGMIFGGLAILGTEWGIPINGAQINCRDAAVLTAGLIFGGPAGILAGCIGACERWIAVAWGIGTFTRVACSFSTLIAGFYAAALRKGMFDDKRPGWIITLLIGVVMETFHLTMVFLTNMSAPDKAYDVIAACTMPMITANAISVAGASLVISLISKEGLRSFRENKKISQLVQRGLLSAVVIGFLVSSLFISSLQSGLTTSEIERVFDNNIIEVEAGIDEELDIAALTSLISLGSGGQVIVFDEGFKNVYTQKDASVEVARELAEKAAGHDEKGLFIEYTSEESVYCKYEQYKGYGIVVAAPYKESVRNKEITQYANSFMEILVFGLLFAYIYFIIKRVVVDKIKEINASLARITGGNLDEEIRVKSNEEFESLSNDINSTVSALKMYIAEAEARLDKELEFAKSIQESSLPVITDTIKNRKEFDLWASMNTAKEVGGDFYDFYFTENGNLNFAIADVSGKGIPAALFMMRAKTELRSLAESGLEVDEIMTTANNALCEGNDAGMFVTAWQGSLNLRTGLLKYANAGHNPPLLKKANGEFDYVVSRAGLVLAGMEGVPYKCQEIQLEPGDVIYLYTDGMTEAINPEKELYGEDRLKDYLNSKEFTSAEEICVETKKNLDEFVGEEPQFDDITLLAVRYLGGEPEHRIDFEEATIDNITEITEFVEGYLESIDCPYKTIVQMNIAIDEIYSNIVKYAYNGKPGPASVIVKELENPHRISLRFIDEGIPYNPLTKEDPDVTLTAEERQIGGLGIYITRQTMDVMKYYYEDDKNVLTIMKNI